MAKTQSDRAVIADTVIQALDEGQVAADVIDWLSREYGARFRLYYGTYLLRVGGLQVSCSAGREPLLRRWVDKARAA